MVIFWERWDGMVFSAKTIGIDGFSMVLLPFDHHHELLFLPGDHWARWFFNGFGVIQPSPFNDFQPPDHCFQWIFDGFQILDINGHQ